MRLFESESFPDVLTISKTITRSDISKLLNSKPQIAKYITSRNKSIKTNYDLGWKPPAKAMLIRCPSIYLSKKYGSRTLFVSICDAEPPVTAQLL